MSNSIVRDAFDGSVTASPVSLEMIHASIVPNRTPPASARFRSPATFRSSHSIFVAVKYGSSTRPVTLSDRPLQTRRAQLLAAFRSPAVLPDDRAMQGLARHAIPDTHGLTLVGDPDREQVPRPAAGIRESLPATAWVTVQISVGSCSTQPGCGKCCANSRMSGRPDVRRGRTRRT